jgi:hypothetical protein
MGMIISFRNWVKEKLQAGSTGSEVHPQLCTVLVLLAATSESLDW